MYVILSLKFLSLRFFLLLTMLFFGAVVFYHKVSELDTKNLTSTDCVKSGFGTLGFSFPTPLEKRLGRDLGVLIKMRDKLSMLNTRLRR